MKEKIKQKINLENILCLFIVICPILDMLSFIFRNIFNTSISPSTILRPIIPIAIILYIFFKDKIKLKLIFVACIYTIYGVVHLIVFNLTKTGWAYSGLAHELQYIINYSFMILNLFIYVYVFKNKDDTNLKKSILISQIIYIVSIFISILTNTSSATYDEAQIGYKGWFESGNSISSILILGMFITLSLIKEKKYKNLVIVITTLIGIYLTTLIGTRVGLYGFVLVIFIYAAQEISVSIFKKVQLNKKIIIGCLVTLCIVVIGVGLVGSKTLERRRMLQEIEKDIVDEKTMEEAHITGDLLQIINNIKNNSLEKGYMSNAEIASLQNLYEFANKYNVTNNDYRTQQLVYNTFLVLNQSNFGLILFGNGYISNFYELVLEMEIPAFLFNFGIIGFLLFFIPFLTILLYAIYNGLKNIKKLDSEYIMYTAGLFCSFALAFLSGYTFFNTSSMIIIIVTCVLLINKVNNIKG